MTRLNFKITPVPLTNYNVIVELINGNITTCEPPVIVPIKKFSSFFIGTKKRIETELNKKNIKFDVYESQEQLN